MRKINALLGLTMAAAAAPAMAQYAPPEQPQAAPGIDRLEQYLWDGAVRTNTPDGFQTYLRRYPQGAHADQARSALDRFYGRAPVQAYPQQQAPYPAQAAPAYPQPEPAQGYPQPAPAYAPQDAAPPEAVAPQVQPALPPTAEPTPPPAAAGGAPVAAAAATVPAPTVVATAKVAGSPLFLCRPVFAGGSPPFEQAGEAEIAAYLQALKVNSVAAYQAYLQAWPHGIFAPAVDELVATREGRAKALAATTVPGPTQAHARKPVVIAPADYPQGLTAAGSATAVWEVAEDGCVQYCRIEKSSGNPALDAATCRTLSARGAYDPARDSAGKPIRAIETGTFSWTAPAK